MKIKIVNCTAIGAIFENLIPGSIHETVDPPAERENREEIWVEGVGEPVRLLGGEYTRMYSERVL